jgi:hypothetical protein
MTVLRSVSDEKWYERWYRENVVTLQAWLADNSDAAVHFDRQVAHRINNGFSFYKLLPHSSPSHVAIWIGIEQWSWTEGATEWVTNGRCH